MKSWLMRAPIHITDIQPSYAGRLWPYEKIFPNDRLRGGDVAYLASGYGDLYAWGYVSKIEPYEDRDLGKEMFRVSVSRPVIRQGLLSAEQVRQSPILAKVLAKIETNLIELTVDEAKALNQLLRSQGVETPPDPEEEAAPTPEQPQSRRANPERTFILNKSVRIEETRYAEFKAVTARNPVDSIKNTADEYAVALLNKEGGSIFWGIRDNDRVVVGLALDYQQRDEIRREVSNKLSQIQPHFPISLFNLDFHPVKNDDRQDIEDLWVFEMDIPGGASTELYATASGEVHVKTDGGKQKLNYSQIVAEVRRRSVQQAEPHDPDEDTMFAIVAEMTRRARTSTGDAWFPEPGSDGHRLAEKMVSRGLLERTPLGIGGYMLPGRINPLGFGGRRF